MAKRYKDIPQEWINDYLRDMLTTPYGQLSPSQHRDRELTTAKAGAILMMVNDWNLSQMDQTKRIR